MLDTAEKWTISKLFSNLRAQAAAVICTLYIHERDLPRFAGRLSQGNRQLHLLVYQVNQLSLGLQKTLINHKMNAVRLLVTTYLRSAVFKSEYSASKMFNLKPYFVYCT